jgi:alginate O-acetyltransferase complex protein AlgI
MFFDTPVFFVFLIVVVVAYWRLSWRRQNGLLLIASYFFYGWWDYRFLALILISTVVDYFCAKAIASSEHRNRRKALLTLSVTLNLGFLGFFKYFDFFIDSMADLLSIIHVDVPRVALRVLLPPGISFYTFQALAYIVDVYFKKLEPAEDFVDYALFISLFPHLIAGPIQRPSHLLPQIQRPRRFSDPDFFSGLQLIATGLFRKCVVADNCALIANAAFNGQLGPPSLAVVAIGTYAFAWQIYGDFSGYSDIARGAAQLMGFHFMVNFRQPFLACSLQDFWRRWHISLSTWLRDYLYIPLGGNRHSERQTYRNLMLTMLIGGLWHGAQWTFVVWGGIHGLGLALERLRGSSAWKKAHSVLAGDKADLKSPTVWLQRIIVFHVVCLAWIYFRAQSLGDSARFLSGITRFAWRPEYATAALFLASFAVPMLALDLMLETRQEEYPFEKSRFPFVRVATAMSLLFLLTWFSANELHAFIYFQF